MLKNEIEKELDKYTLYLEIKHKQLILINTADKVLFPNVDYLEKDQALSRILELTEKEKCPFIPIEHRHIEIGSIWINDKDYKVEILDLGEHEL